MHPRGRATDKGEPSDVDARDIDPTSVRFGIGEAPMAVKAARLIDLEGDGDGTEAALGNASGPAEAETPADTVATMVEDGLGIKGSKANG